MITIQNYVRVQSLEEAYELNQKKNNMIIAGMLWTKMQNKNINTAIDLCDLGLDSIEETSDVFSIGAMVTLRQLEKNESLNNYSNNLIKDSVTSIIGVQFRNTATVGGSIWGRYGFSDILSAFMAMDTAVELYKGGIVPLKEFASMKPDNDILVRIIVRKRPGRFIYSSMRNQRTDFPVITCASSCIEGKYRAVIGARPGRAVEISDDRDILSKGITEESALAFAEYVASQVKCGSNLRGSEEYRTHLIRVLTTRNIIELGGCE